VAERLGFGPNVCLQRNPRIIYGRMADWGFDESSIDALEHQGVLG
jgi:alpha-methylacyl-CoA racemase